MPDLTDLTDPRMLRTVTALQQWIAGQLEQHEPRGDERCSCGWAPPLPEPGFIFTHQEHVDTIVLSDLGDVLASDSSDGTGTNINGVTVEPVTVRWTPGAKKSSFSCGSSRGKTRNSTASSGQYKSNSDSNTCSTYATSSTGEESY